MYSVFRLWKWLHDILDIITAGGTPWSVGYGFVLYRIDDPQKCPAFFFSYPDVCIDIN